MLQICIYMMHGKSYTMPLAYSVNFLRHFIVCTHYDTLVRKLCYDVAKHDPAFLKSYLSDKVQRVDANGARSSEPAISTDFNEGSILGPFRLFNDLSSHMMCI